MAVVEVSRAIHVKICGITREDDAVMVVGAGADWLGLNFWPRSKRYIDAGAGERIARAARAAGQEVEIVGVFVNHDVDEVAAIAEQVGLEQVQLHGDESPEMCAALAARGLSVIKAVPMASAVDVEQLERHPVNTFLIDTPTSGYGGSGRTFDWSLARLAVATGKRIILAGGLTPENVATAVAEVRPFGVDVASGVESAPGVKDPARVRAFVERARGRTRGPIEAAGPRSGPDERA